MSLMIFSATVVQAVNKLKIKKKIEILKFLLIIKTPLKNFIFIKFVFKKLEFVSIMKRFKMKWLQAQTTNLLDILCECYMIMPDKSITKFKYKFPGKKRNAS
jgi:hypothetical protein